MIERSGKSYEDIIDTFITPLGGVNHRILVQSKPRSNSHGIVVDVLGNMITWTWPNLSGDDIGLSPEGMWFPIQKAYQEGLYPNPVQCNQFCDIANRGGWVVKSVYGNMQLKFPLPQKRQFITPASNLSATATEFVHNPPTTQQHEGSKLSHSALPFMSAMQYPTTKQQQPLTQLSPSALPFTPKITPPSSANITNSPVSNSVLPQTVKEQRSPDSPVYVSVLPQTVTEQRSPVEVNNESGDELKEKFQEQINRDAAQLQNLGWKNFVNGKRKRGDLTSLENVHHPARPYLEYLGAHGSPVEFSTAPWSREKIDQALSRGAHKSCMGFLEFLHEEFVDMINKGQWVILPASAVKDMPGLRIFPQRGRRPRWIVDYSFWGVNDETLPLAALESMQFGNALDRILREILMADPRYGPVELMKIDLSDGFYRVDLNVGDVPKLGVVFPTEPGEEQLVAFPLVLPMGWTNSPPHFSSFTETITDLANARM